MASNGVLPGLGGALWLGAFEWTRLLLWPSEDGRSERSDRATTALLQGNIFQGT